jgi:hypothetical protein
MQTHEAVSSFRKVKLSSNRNFGLIFGALFLILGLWPLIHGLGASGWAWLLVGVAFLGVAWCAPNWLTPLNRAWFKLGLVLGKIASPIVMGLLFFLAVVPFSWYVRWRNKDLLNLTIDPQARSYWIERDPPGPLQGSLTKQF